MARDAEILIVLCTDRFKFDEVVDRIRELTREKNNLKVGGDEYKFSFIPLRRKGNNDVGLGEGDGDGKIKKYKEWRKVRGSKGTGAPGKGNMSGIEDRGELNIKLFQPIGLSPFGDYETWMEESVYNKITAECKDYEHPALEGVEEVLSKMEKKLKDMLKDKPAEKPKDVDPSKFYNGSTIFNSVTLAKMEGKDKRGHTSEVMGIRAVEIAESFGWKEKTVTEKWDGKRNSKEEIAQWLHVLAHSWGGLGDIDPKIPTEIPKNLIFGSKECNQLMGRYEKNWQASFEKDGDLETDPTKRAKGLVTGNVRYSGRGHVELSETDREALKKASWLCFTLESGLTFSPGRSPSFLGPVWPFSTLFFPFRRRPGLAFELRLDDLLLEKLISKHQALKNERPEREEASATTSSGRLVLEAMPPNAAPAASYLTNEHRSPVELCIANGRGPPAGSWMTNEHGLPTESYITTEHGPLPRTASGLMPYALTVFPVTNTPSPVLSLNPMILPQQQQPPTQQSPPGHTQPHYEVWDHMGAPQGDTQPHREVWDDMGAPPPGHTQPHYEVWDHMGAPQGDTQPHREVWDDMGAPPPGHTQPHYEVWDDMGAPPGHTQPHHEVWDHMHAGKTTVHLDGTPVQNPRFVGVRGGRLVDRHPSELTHNDPSTVDRRRRRLDSQAPVSVQDLTYISHQQPDEVLGFHPHMGLGVRPVAVAVGTSGPSYFRRSGEPPRGPAPDGFLVKGDIRLFGLIPATLYSFQGTARESSIDEMVMIRGDLSLGQVIPSLQDCVIDEIHLKSAKFTYTKSYRRDRSPGLRFETDVVFEGQLKVVGDALQTLFNQKNPALHLSGLVGLERDWNSPLFPAGFTLSGSFEQTSVKLGNLIEFTSVGVQLMASPAVEVYPRFRRYHKFSYGFFGSANITVPASVVPLSVNYSVQHNTGMYHIHLEAFDKGWENVCGVEGLNVTEVQFDVSVSTSAPRRSLSLEVRATIDIEHAQISLSGFYSLEQWALQGVLEEVDLKVLGRLFQHMFGVELQDFTDHTITFSSLLLDIGTAGLTLAGTVTIDHYTSTNATISISRAGLLIKGSVADVDLHFSDDDGLEGIRLDSAFLNVFIGKNDGTGERSVKTVIEGKISFAGISFSAGLYWKKHNAQHSQWTVYADYAQELKLSGLDSAHDLKDTFLDLSVKHVAFLASSIDVPDGTFSENFRYPIKKGVRMCAMIDRIHEFNEISRSDVSDLLLSASYVSGGGLAIEVAVATDNVLSFGRTVTARSLKLGIKIARVPALVIRAEMSVKVPKRDSPLIFGFNLEAGLTGANGSAEIKESWESPFDISPRVTIGPNMALELGIIYMEFFTTGIPSQVGASGGLTIGNTTGTVAVLLSENPTEELLSASIDEFGLDDLMDLASDIAGIEIHHPPQEMLRIHTVKLYISSGVMLGTSWYPKGVQFAASMDIFGKNASIDCKLGNELKITGSVDEFQLGPLSVTGTGANKRAIIDLELGRDKQLLVVNGSVIFLELSVAVDVEVEFLPSPKFKFDIELDFNSIFKFTLQAKMLGEVDFKETSNLDFSLYARLEQRLLAYIASEAKNYFEKVRRDAAEGLDSARRGLEGARESYEQGVTQAQSDLDVAERAWTEEQREVHAAFDEASAASKAELKVLQEDVNRTEAAYYKALEAAKNGLKTARRDADAAISEAQAGVRKAEGDGNAGIEYHRQQVLRAEQDMDQQFGGALRDLANARDDVERKEANLEDVQRQVLNMDRRIDAAAWYEKPGLWIFKTELQASVGVAQGALFIAEGAVRAAEAIVEGPGYLGAKAAIEGYKGALSGAEGTAKAALEGANGILDGVRITQDGTVAAAEATVSTVETASQEFRAFDAARGALRFASERSVDVLGGLQAGIDGLSTSVKLGAFNSARAILDAAKHHTELLDAASGALDLAQGIEEGAVIAAENIIDAAAGAFQVTRIEISAKSLREVIENKEGLWAKIEVVVGGRRSKFDLEYRLGDPVSFLNGIFEELGELLPGIAA